MNKLISSLLLVFGFLSTVSAQTTYTWTGGAGNASWNVAGNWTGGVPVSGTNIISLNNTTQTITTQNITDPFQLNQLNMLVDASNGFTVNGNGLQFAGSGAQITNQAAALLRVNTPINLTGNLSVDLQANNTSGAELRLSGPITASAGTVVTVTSSTTTPAVMTLLDSASPNFLGTFEVNSNTIIQTSQNNFAARSVAINTTGGAQSTFAVGATTASGLASDTGISTQIGSFTGIGQLQIGSASAASASTALVGFNNNTLDAVTGTVSVSNSASHLAKVGTGEWRFTGTTNNTVNGGFSVRDGVVNFQNSTASNGGFGTASTGLVSIYAGGEFRTTLTGTGSNGRLGNGQPVTLSGGLLRYNLSGMGTLATGYSELAGQLTAGAGQSTIQIDVAANRGSRLSFATLGTPNATGSLVFLSDNLGNLALNTVASGNVNFGTAPTGQLVGGTTTYGASTQNLSILPYAIAGTTTGGIPTTFVTYDGGTNASIRRLEDTNYASDFTGATTNNVSLNSAAATVVNTTTTANAVRLTAGSSIDNSSTLTLTAGALLNNGGGSVTGAGTLQFGPAGSRTAFITTNAASSISNTVSASNIAKSGSGNLTLSGPINLNGTTGYTVAANAGTLTLGAGATITPSNALSSTNQLTYQVSRNATINASATGLILPAFQNLTGQGTVVGNVTVGATGAANGSSGRITPSALGGASSIGLASPGVITVNGNLNFLPGGNYVWYISSVQGGSYTQSNLAVTGDLNLTSLSASERFTIRPTSLLLSNSNTGNVYDFNSSNTYQWPILTTSGTINGYSDDKFTVDASAFTNSLGIGEFTVSNIGNTIYLNFAPVPEPATILGVGLLTLAGGTWLRRRLKK